MPDEHAPNLKMRKERSSMDFMRYFLKIYDEKKILLFFFFFNRRIEEKNFFSFKFSHFYLNGHLNISVSNGNHVVEYFPNEDFHWKR